MATFGDIANVAQLTGLDAVRLIGVIAKAANNARMHKKNCRQFANHLKLIGNLLDQLNISKLKKYPETREPLEQLEDALRRAYVLVESCKDRSYLYLLAMGWNIVYNFRQAQNEIDRYLKLIPLITMVDNARVRERLEAIEKDQREYTFDDDYQELQTVIMNPEPAQNDTVVLKKSLSTSYPNMGFNEALQKESEKLKRELQQSQAHLNVGQCEMIQHLIEVTEAAAANSRTEKSSAAKCYSDSISEKEYSYSKSYSKQSDCHMASINTSTVSSGRNVLSTKSSYHHEEWHTDLLDCCSEPSLCMRTLFCPCGTFSKIATVANGTHMSSAEACNDLMAYSLVLSCCCYTCCIRRRLRNMLNITGGVVDDFLSHFMCCCCALVQEWREVEIRGFSGPHGRQARLKEAPYLEALSAQGTRKVEEGLISSPAGLSSGISTKGKVCCVCLSRLKKGQEMHVLPCQHEFHKICINRWFTACRKTCPLCRFSLEKSCTKGDLTDEWMIWFSSFHAAGF